MRAWPGKIPVLTAILALGAACGEPAAITAAAPDVVRPGRPVTLAGTGFDEDLVVHLRRLIDPDSNPATWSEPVPVPVAALSPTEATLDLPSDLAPGTWVVAAGEPLPLTPQGPALPHGRLEVWTPETDPPCAKHHALDVQTFRTKGTVVVRRLFTDAEPETLSIEHDAMDGLLVGRDGDCAWVKLTRRDADPVLIFDAPGAHDRAQQVAGALAIALDVPLRTP